MGDLSRTTPKPLITVGGRTMLDRAIDSLVAAGAPRVVVNVHHLADQLEARARARTDVEMRISDERAALLDTGGGVRKALPLLDHSEFFTRNSDCFWIDMNGSHLGALLDAWRPERRGAVLLLAERSRAIGHDGPGDFFLGADGRLTRRDARETAPFIYAGAQIMHASLFDKAPVGAFSLNHCWDAALQTGSLYGIVLKSEWYHVGDPKALEAAEAHLASRSLDAPAHPL